MALSRSASKSKEEDHEGVNQPTLIAIDKDKNSQSAVIWAVENLLLKKKNPQHCILIHVRNQTLHPHDTEAVAKEGRPPTAAELQQLFLPYRGFCARKGIQAKEVVLHDIDVPSALVDYIDDNNIRNAVVGASNRNALLRKFKNADVSSSLLKLAPESCTVYVISKGKVQNKRAAYQLQKSSAISSDTPKSNAATPVHHTLRSQETKSDMSDSEELNRIMQMNRKSSGTKNDQPRLSTESNTSGNSSHQSSTSGASDFSGPLSFRSTGTISSDNLDLSLYEETNSRSSVSLPTSHASEAEMRKLKLELKQTMEMYNSACKEALAARKRTMELQQLKTKDKKKLEEAILAEEAALALAEVEKQKRKAATEAAVMAQRLAELETQKRKTAELKAIREAEERKKSIDTLAQNHVRYRKYTIEEIEVATDYFENSNKIGEGGYGPVYKAMLDHTSVAIKVLRPDISEGQKQFQQEVEVLSCLRHPHMVLLLGACPEYGCLVYEYMENGSLEDCLLRKDNTPPIPWRIRFSIAAEVATALLFLHQAKPEPLVHRDLKPANILLNRNYASKISDVGLARLVPAPVADGITQCRLTAAAGTFSYIDPEYQQTGRLCVKSDIYSFGITLLQIITAKPSLGLSRIVEEAITNGTFSEVLDPAVTDWPVEEALSFAKIALQCCELRKRDRPDLHSVVLPELNRLKDIGLDNGPRITHQQRPYSSVPQMGGAENKEEMRNNPNVEMEIQPRSV